MYFNETHKCISYFNQKSKVFMVWLPTVREWPFILTNNYSRNECGNKETTYGNLEAGWRQATGIW